MKHKIELFKITFCSITTGLFVGLLVYNFFDIDFSNSKSLLDLFIRCLITSFFVGLVLGILNAVFEIALMNRK